MTASEPSQTTETPSRFQHQAKNESAPNPFESRDARSNVRTALPRSLLNRIPLGRFGHSRSLRPPGKPCPTASRRHTSSPARSPSKQFSTKPTIRPALYARISTVKHGQDPEVQLGEITEVFVQFFRRA